MNSSVKLGTNQWLIIALTVATAVIHLVLGLPDGLLFILNGLGYLGLLGVLYLPLSFLDGFRGAGRWALIAYTAITFILYFVFNWPDVWGVLGIIDKVIELALIVLLLREPS